MINKMFRNSKFALRSSSLAPSHQGLCCERVEVPNLALVIDDVEESIATYKKDSASRIFTIIIFHQCFVWQIVPSSEGPVRNAIINCYGARTYTTKRG